MTAHVVLKVIKVDQIDIRQAVRRYTSVVRPQAYNSLDIRRAYTLYTLHVRHQANMTTYTPCLYAIYVGCTPPCSQEDFEKHDAVSLLK